MPLNRLLCTNNKYSILVNGGIVPLNVLLNNNNWRNDVLVTIQCGIVPAVHTTRAISSSANTALDVVCYLTGDW